MDDAKHGKTEFLDMTSIDSGFGKKKILKNFSFVIHPGWRAKLWWDNLVNLFVVSFIVFNFPPRCMWCLYYL